MRRLGLLVIPGTLCVAVPGGGYASLHPARECAILDRRAVSRRLGAAGGRPCGGRLGAAGGRACGGRWRGLPSRHCGTVRHARQH